MSAETTPAVADREHETDRALKPSKDDGDGSNWFARIALVLVCIIFLIPTIGILVSSFRAQDQVRTSGWWTVFTGGGFTPTLENYTSVLDAGMGTSFINSLAVAIPATVIPILAATFAAYAFAWMDFKGREVLFIIFVGMLVLPLQAALIPMTRLYNAVGMDNEFLRIWLFHTGFGMPLAVYILRNYIGSLPKEVIESAKVDGASHFATFWRLIMPLSVPALAAFGIFQFLWTWNDYLVALVFLTQGDEVVTITLAELVGSRGQDWHLLTAGAFVSMTIPLIVFFSLQRFFVRGMTAGAVKG